MRGEMCVGIPVGVGTGVGWNAVVGGGGGADGCVGRYVVAGQSVGGGENLNV